MSDLWGFCSECERWFFCEASEQACPVCSSIPSEVQDRELTTES